MIVDIDHLLSPDGAIARRLEQFESRPDDVESALLDGAKRARAIGGPVLEEVRRTVGFRVATDS